jgi:hypothetical protein
MTPEGVPLAAAADREATPLTARPGQAQHGPRTHRRQTVPVTSRQQRWWLDNAERLNEENPSSFFIPPSERRRALVPGDMVKLIFRFDPPSEEAGGERMWVDVVSVEPKGYLGVLVNQPKYIRGIGPGSRITFAPEHVAAVAVSEEEVGYDVDAWAAVSRRIRDEAAWPHFVYRNPRSRRELEQRDSGWELWAREDDDAYVSDATNVLCWDLGWITDKFPLLEDLFRSGVEEGQWWWDADAGTYRRRA